MPPVRALAYLSRSSLLLLAALALSGCDDESSSGGSSWPWASGGGAGSAGVAGAAGSPQGGQGGAASGAGSAGAPAGVTRSELCDAFIACTAETSAAGLGVVLAAYGAQGNCWSQGSLALCNDACAQGLKDALEAFPQALSCNRCSTEKDCNSSLPACDPGTKRCVRCLADDHCQGTSKRACDTLTHTCVDCTSDLHCQNKTDGKPFCNPGKNSCVNCLNSSQCAGSSSFICDAPSGSCRGCQINEECPAGFCIFGVCSCLQQADCPAGLSCEQSPESLVSVCK